MSDVHYGVIQQNGRWIIVGDNLRFGSYARRSSAVRAARRLAQISSGLPVHLHVQDEDGKLPPSEQVHLES